MVDAEPNPSQPSERNLNALAAEFEPLPRIGVVEAARRHWLLVLLPILVLVPVVAAVAAVRKPTYSAESRLMIGRLNISAPGAIQGYTQAVLDLASSYPAVVTSSGVVDRVARDLHTSPTDVANHLSATQVPSSQIIRVDTTATSSAGAVRLANVTAKAVAAYVATLNGQNPDLSFRLAQVRQAELAYQQALAKAPRGHGPFSPKDQKLAAAAATAKVQINSAETNYQSALQNTTVTSLVQPLVFAKAATNDRWTKLEIAVLAALAAGIVLGLAFATLRANMLVRRALLAPSDWQSFPSASSGDPHTGEAHPGRARESSH